MRIVAEKEERSWVRVNEKSLRTKGRRAEEGHRGRGSVVMRLWSVMLSVLRRRYRRRLFQRHAVLWIRVHAFPSNFWGFVSVKAQRKIISLYYRGLHVRCPFRSALLPGTKDLDVTALPQCYITRTYAFVRLYTIMPLHYNSYILVISKLHRAIRPYSKATTIIEHLILILIILALVRNTRNTNSTGKMVNTVLYQLREHTLLPVHGYMVQRGV